MRPSLSAALAGCAILYLSVAPTAAATDCPYQTAHCPGINALPGNNSGGVSFNLNGARVSVVLKADANTQTSNGTPTVETGASGVLGITLDDDPDSNATGEVAVHLNVPDVAGWSWQGGNGSGHVNRTFTFDLTGGARVETFSFEVASGAATGGRAFDVGVFVGDAGNRVPLSAVVEPGAASTTTSTTSGSEDDTKPSPPPGLAAGLAVAGAALLAARRRRA